MTLVYTDMILYAQAGLPTRALCILRAPPALTKHLVRRSYHTTVRGIPLPS